MNDTIGDLIVPTDCALGITGVCMSCELYDVLSKFRKEIIKKDGNPSKEEVIYDVMKYLNVQKEIDILNNDIFKKFVDDPSMLLKEKRVRYKVQGPASSTKLLDNNVIDSTLQQMTRECFIKDNEFTLFSSLNFTGELKSIMCSNEKIEGDNETYFYPVPFQMIDFYDTNTELANLDVVSIFNKGFNTIGMVLNTDVSTGRGIHWFALFIDGRGDQITIENFNSSGENPYPVILKKMVEIEKELIDNGCDVKNVEVHNAIFTDIQKSRTECGVWSLVYIYSRIKGKPITWLDDMRATDKDMYEIRSKLFRD